MEYTINHSETGICFVHENKVKFLLKALPKLKTLKAVVVWGNPSKDVIDNIAKQVGPHIDSAHTHPLPREECPWQHLDERC